MISSYQALPGVPDEMVDASGKVRSLWQGLAGHLAEMKPEALAESLTRADRYLRDSGVFYRQYGSGLSMSGPGR